MSTASAFVSILVVPYGATHPMTGGGQRTRLLFDGLKLLGPVVVVYIGFDAKKLPGPSEFFCGAHAIEYIADDTFGPSPDSRLRRNLDGAIRLLLPISAYRIRAVSRDRLSKIILTYNPAIVSFRYTRTFAAIGLKKLPDADYRIAVDIDDRDDMKAMSQLLDRLPSAVFAPFINLILSRFKKHLFRHWSEADLLWLAKEADFLPDLQTQQELLPNVPQVVPEQDDIVPAESTDPIILFVGSAGHRMNLEGVDWFLRNCWQSIITQKPDARLRLVGLGDWSRIRVAHDNTEGLEIIGAVDDLSAEYAIARLTICPVRVAAGSQIKVIEACGHARAIVATPLAATGFGQEIMSEIVSCQNADDFAHACISFLNDPDLASKTGLRLRDLQQKEFSRESSIRQIGRTINLLRR